MQIEGQRSRIIGSSNQTRRNQDEGRKDEKSIGLADFKKS